MDIERQLREPGAEAYVTKAVRTVYTAEQEDAPIQNGKQRDLDVSKNTHFEFKFGGDEYPEVAVYIERLHEDSGIEVMIWADQSWFDEDAEFDYGPDLADGGEALDKFGDTLLDIVADVIDAEQKPQFQWIQSAPPSDVFQAIFYL